MVISYTACFKECFPLLLKKSILHQFDTSLVYSVRVMTNTKMFGNYVNDISFQTQTRLEWSMGIYLILRIIPHRGFRPVCILMLEINDL